MERLLTAVGAAEQASQVRRIRTDLQPPPQAQRGTDPAGQFPFTANAAAALAHPVMPGLTSPALDRRSRPRLHLRTQAVRRRPASSTTRYSSLT
jgi:hypothetical protein